MSIVCRGCGDHLRASPRVACAGCRYCHGCGCRCPVPLPGRDTRRVA
jgi:hypothetical protein